MIAGLFLISGVIAPGNTFDETESNVTSIILSEEDNEIEWEVEGYSAQGFKVVWSMNENPEYPLRDGDKYKYFSNPDTRKTSLTAFNGTGTYYVRVCEYLGGLCGVYSNEIVVELEKNYEKIKSEKVCCHKFGYGAGMEKVQSKYVMIDKESCVTPEDFVGGGREIVDDSFCVGSNTIGEKVRDKVKEKIQGNFNESNCPEECICSGATIKCMLASGREMTVHAGKSGNTIIQVKNTNMSTEVTLYKKNETIIGEFKNGEREVKIMPDQVEEKLKERVKARLELRNITLDENGNYQVQTKKRARLFFLIPVREHVEAQIDSSTGEILKMKNPWWGFLARDVKEE